MFRLGNSVQSFTLVKKNVMSNLCIKNVLAVVIHNSQETNFYPSKVLQHTLCYNNSKALISLDLLRVNLKKKMSTSVNEEFRHLDYSQLVTSKNTPNNIIIDVREKHELDETGKIPGAYHIPLGEVETALIIPEDDFKKKYNFDKPSTDDTVIFSCRSGKRSLAALEKALAHGFKNAKHYKGGWLDWEKHL